MPRDFRPIAALFIIVLLGGVGYFTQTRDGRMAQLALLPGDALPPQPDAFGFLDSAFEVEQTSVQRGAVLNDVLAGAGVEADQRPLVVEAMLKEPALSRIRAGQGVHVYRTEDNALSHLVFELNRTSYAVVAVHPVLSVRVHEKQAQTQVKTASGTIQGSLHATLNRMNVPSAMANRLSDIFQWKVDFHRLQPGDQIRLVYEEESVGAKVTGIGAILAAELVHGGKSYTAFRYEIDGKASYFDREGKSLRSQFLMAPVAYGRISSAFSMRRLHPVQRVYKAHLGTDYAAPTGTPIMAVGDGVVTEARFQRANGNYVRIRHNGTYETQYLHMSRFATGIRPGTRVTQGQVIGYVGSTGLATGPHVCFRFWKNGVQVDHRAELQHTSEPLPEASMESFQQVVSALQPTLAPSLWERLPTVRSADLMRAPDVRAIALDVLAERSPQAE